MMSEDGVDTNEGTGEQAAKETVEEKQRKVLSESERIKMLRDRLYARGNSPERLERHSLTEAPAIKAMDMLGRNVSSSSAATQSKQGAAEMERIAFSPVPIPPHPTPTASSSIQTMIEKKRSRSYRFKLASFAILFFLGAIAVSAFFLFQGNNTISGQNISVSAKNAPLTVAGGSEIGFTIAVANNNPQPIEAVTLIVEYPRGTQSVSERGKELYTERHQLDRIASGETVNVDLRAIIFGEENQEQVIQAKVEYRISGSGGIFQKQADPIRFTISTPPVMVTLDGLKEISSGQELEFEMTVVSNATTRLENLLLKVGYPFGFDFSSAKPEPISGEDTWSITSIEPGEQKKITFRGVATGRDDDLLKFQATIGVPNERDRFTLASSLMSTSYDVKITPPFLDVSIRVNGEDGNGEPIIISTSNFANVGIRVENALDSTLFNGIIRAKLSGNALDEVDVRVSDGFYDSTTNTITWDSVDVSGLKELAPGASEDVTFVLNPDTSIGRTPELTVNVSVESQRIFEDRVPQVLTGTVEQVIRVESIPKLSSSAIYSDGPFTNTGPTPPVAEKVTQYTFLFILESGSNDITGAEMTAILPQYVTWLDLVTDDDDLRYDPTTRTIKWVIGNMKANEREEAWAQVSFKPSLSQVNISPVLLETQRFKATDRFTGTTIRTDASALTTRLVNDPDPEKRDGKVRKE